MNTAIQNTISQYFTTFIVNAATKFNIPQDQLEELWKETQKEKLKIHPRRRATKKTPSAYINFCNHRRKVIKVENPTMTFGEVAKLLGKSWKELDAEEKKKHVDPTYVSVKEVVVDEDVKKIKRRKNKE